MEIIPKPEHPKLVFGLVIGAVIMIIASELIGRGTGWITLFGVDFGYSSHSGSIWISKAPGGFFHWWEAFSERKFEPRLFGLGYGSLNAENHPSHMLPKIHSEFDGKVKTLALPLWILISTFIAFLAIELLPRFSPKKLSE